MPSPRTDLPNSKLLAADSKQLHADESLSRKGRLEITIIIIIVLALFFAAQVLPTGEWLKLAAQYESSFIDEMILIFVVLSFVFPVFSIIRWRDLRREVAARALLVR